MSAIMTKTSIEAAQLLRTLIESHARDHGRQLGEWLRPGLREGETLPDFDLVLQLPARMLDQACHHLQECEDKLDESKSHEDEALHWRNHTASQLRRKLVEVRRFLTAACGPRAGKLLGISGKTALASQPALLVSQAESVLRVLREPKRLSIPSGGCFDPAAAAAGLEPMLDAGRKAVGQLDEKRQASAVRREARDRAVSDLWRAGHGVASIVVGWFSLIRRMDLVGKLRAWPRLGKTKS